MTPERFAAILANDADAEKCATCSMGPGGAHADDPAAAVAYCNRMFREEWERRSVLPLWRRDNPKPRTCSNPDEHHPFVPGGTEKMWDGGDVDRRDLLNLLRETARWVASATGYPWDMVTAERPPAPVFDLIVEAHWREEVERMEAAGHPIPALEEFRAAAEIEATWSPGS